MTLITGTQEILKASEAIRAEQGRSLAALLLRACGVDPDGLGDLLAQDPGLVHDLLTGSPYALIQHGADPRGVDRLAHLVGKADVVVFFVATLSAAMEERSRRGEAVVPAGALAVQIAQRMGLEAAEVERPVCTLAAQGAEVGGVLFWCATDGSPVAGLAARHAAAASLATALARQARGVTGRSAEDVRRSAEPLSGAAWERVQPHLGLLMPLASAPLSVLLADGVDDFDGTVDALATLLPGPHPLVVAGTAAEAARIQARLAGRAATALVTQPQAVAPLASTSPVVFVRANGVALEALAAALDRIPERASVCLYGLPEDGTFTAAYVGLLNAAVPGVVRFHQRLDTACGASGSPAVWLLRGLLTG